MISQAIQSGITQSEKQWKGGGGGLSMCVCECVIASAWIG